MSVNAVDQTTGNTTPLAGNTNNLVGNLSALTTNTKSDAVGAINEVNQTKQNATDNNLQTTNKTIVGGINELVSGLNGKASIISSGFINEGSHVDFEIADTESLYLVYCAKYDSATIYAVFTTGTDAFPLVLHSGSATVTASGLTITITPDANTSCRYTILKVI